jgi:hypothetical protein
MFPSPFYHRKPGTRSERTTVGQHLSARQLAFETFIKHISTSTLAIVMLLALALLSALRGQESDTKGSALAKAPTTHVAVPEQGRSFSNCDPKDFGNKSALNR